jgi:hypothetical protein
VPRYITPLTVLCHFSYRSRLATPSCDVVGPVNSSHMQKCPRAAIHMNTHMRQSATPSTAVSIATTTSTARTRAIPPPPPHTHTPTHPHTHTPTAHVRVQEASYDLGGLSICKRRPNVTPRGKERSSDQRRRRRRCSGGPPVCAFGRAAHHTVGGRPCSVLRRRRRAQLDHQSHRRAAPAARAYEAGDNGANVESLRQSTREER